ncbi:MAG: hypothetical protein RL291_459 [Pseudomonadota bacterium]
MSASSSIKKNPVLTASDLTETTQNDDLKNKGNYEAPKHSTDPPDWRESAPGTKTGDSLADELHFTGTLTGAIVADDIHQSFASPVLLDRRTKAKRNGSHLSRALREKVPLPEGVALTFREAQVLRWIAEGKSDWQIGIILRIAPKTVNYHTENAKKKLGVATRIQAAFLADRAGLLDSIKCFDGTTTRRI